MLIFCFPQMCTPIPVAVCLVQGVAQFCSVTSTVMEVRALFWSVATPLHTPVPTVRMLGFSVSTDCTQVRLRSLLPDLIRKSQVCVVMATKTRHGHYEITSQSVAILGNEEGGPGCEETYYPHEVQNNYPARACAKQG